jgi:hypothetical protein
MKYFIALCLVVCFFSLTAQSNSPLHIIWSEHIPMIVIRMAVGQQPAFSANGLCRKICLRYKWRHQTEGGGALAKRRTAEAHEAGKRFGVTYEVVDNHDGELLPTLVLERETKIV